VTSCETGQYTQMYTNTTQFHKQRTYEENTKENRGAERGSTDSGAT